MLSAGRKKLSAFERDNPTLPSVRRIEGFRLRPGERMHHNIFSSTDQREPHFVPSSTVFEHSTLKFAVKYSLFLLFSFIGLRPSTSFCALCFIVR